MHKSVTPRLRKNYFLCRAEKEWGTRGGMDAVLEVLAASTRRRKYAVMLRMRYWEGMHPSRTAHLCWLEQGPCCCCCSQEAGTSPSSCPPQGWEHAPWNTLLGKQCLQELSNSTQPREFTIVEYSSYCYWDVLGLMPHHVLLKNGKS